MNLTKENEPEQDSSDVGTSDPVAMPEWRARGYYSKLGLSEDSKDALLLAFGVILPVCAVAFESQFHFCARYFFDPFPSTNHIVLFSLIPISNLMAWMTRRANLSTHFAFMSLSSGMAMGIALMYALMFLPLAGPAMFSLVYLGFGLLGLTPLLSLPCLWFSGKRVCHLADQRKTYFEAHQLKHFGHIVVLVMVLAVELPSTLTRMNLGLAVHPETEKQGVEWLRKYGNQEVLLRACYERSGRATDIIGSMYESGHPIKIEDARRIFYRVTGKPFNSVPIPASARSTIKNANLANDPAGLNAVISDEFDLDADVASEQVSGVVRGLRAVNSSMQVKMQPDALLASIDWSFHFGNSSKYDREARGKIMLPPGAVVTKATLTVAGVEHDATIMVREAARAIYQEAVKAHKEDPLLVSTCGPDQILVQCFPVHPGGDLKVDLHIVAPMVLGQKTSEASFSLPTFVERNFQMDDNTLFEVLPAAQERLADRAAFNFRLAGGVSVNSQKSNNSDASKMIGSPASTSKVLKVSNEQLADFKAIVTANRNGQLQQLSFTDPFLTPTKKVIFHPGPQYFKRPDELTVLIDGSISMKGYMAEIAKGLRSLPKETKLRVFILGDAPTEISKSGDLEHWSRLVASYDPAGGQDNSYCLLAFASELQSKKDAAILWIHGTQPVSSGSGDSLASFLSLRKSPLLYDLQVSGGPVDVLSSVKNGAGFKHVDRTGSVESDISLLVQSWQGGEQSAPSGRPSEVQAANGSAKSSEVPSVNESAGILPASNNFNGVKLDLAPSRVAPVNKDLAQLLAYNRLLRELQFPKNQGSCESADALAKTYHLVTPISSAVVVDEIAELDRDPKPAPKDEAKPDPVLQAKDLLDHSFDHIDAFLAYTKYEWIDREVHPTLKQMHPGSSLTGLLGFMSNPIDQSFDKITSQLNKLNSVTESSGSSAGGSVGFSDMPPTGSTEGFDSAPLPQPAVVSPSQPQSAADGPAFNQEAQSFSESSRMRASIPVQFSQSRVSKIKESSSSQLPQNLPTLAPHAMSIGRIEQKFAPKTDSREFAAKDRTSFYDLEKSQVSRLDSRNAQASKNQVSAAPILSEAKPNSIEGASSYDAASTAPAAPARTDDSSSEYSVAGKQQSQLLDAKRESDKNSEIATDSIAGLTKRLAGYAGAKKSPQVSKIEFAEKAGDKGTFDRDEISNRRKRQTAEDAESQSSDALSNEQIAEPMEMNSSLTHDMQLGQLEIGSPSLEVSSIAGTARIDSQRYRPEHQRASRALTMLCLIFAAATALVTLYNAPVKTGWIYCRSIMIVLAMPVVFYVLGNFLMPVFEQFLK